LDRTVGLGPTRDVLDLDDIQANGVDTEAARFRAPSGLCRPAADKLDPTAASRPARATLQLASYRP